MENSADTESNKSGSSALSDPPGVLLRSMMSSLHYYDSGIDNIEIAAAVRSDPRFELNSWSGPL
ncbi:hypothetical protein P692DRAFT_20838114 [Suillus brevipes Sb2]|nr:hypothetical protein P692DRAFT_20838114 [Suillus brevipes Sb2]